MKWLANNIATWKPITLSERKHITQHEYQNLYCLQLLQEISRCGEDVISPLNYRPVSLTCVPCKILEHIICKHIRLHLEKHGILTPLNHGFRSKFSCETQLLVTLQDLLSAQDVNCQIDLAVLDFSKAFDTVPHERLLGKLDFYGVQGPILNWIAAFLKNRVQSVPERTPVVPPTH